MQEIKLAFIGNPNCGKTTLFNAYTGQRLKVANYPGVTIEKKEGELEYKNKQIVITDLPGIYSLNSYSIEEKVSKEFIENEDLDVIIDVVDASSLERNLYLTLQLIENNKNIIIALNMIDIVKKRGMNIDIKKLEETLGTKVIPISAKTKEGIDELLEAIINQKNKNSKNHIKIDNEYNILAKYNYIENLVKECTQNKMKVDKRTEKIDKILTHKIWGLPIFIMIMGTVFLLTFTLGDYIKGYFELILELIINKTLLILAYLKIGPAMTSLITEGIITGVGGILTFIPNIFILFLCLGFLEDTGYMSRVAYIMNGFMEKLGLSGKACIPMILGFGCSVPAVMATRTLKEEKDRRKTIMLIPCMSCSAKIPIYVLFAGIFFKKYEAIVALGMYVIGIAISLILGIVTKRIEKSPKREELIIELPEYKIPDYNSIKIYVIEKIKDYINKAGTIIFLSSIILWGILNIGKTGFVENPEKSFGAIIGKLLIPIFKPTGLGYWQIIVALISGLIAKEVVVSSINVLYGINAVSQNYELYDILMLESFTKINAFCLMLFCLLYVPCIATIATIHSETKSTKFTIKLICFQLLMAWTVTTITYQLLKLI